MLFRSKQKLNLLISAFFGEKINENITTIVHSCKDNLSIKGTEKLVKSLSEYNKKAKSDDKVVCLILPINKPHSGPVERLVKNLSNQTFIQNSEGEYLTHHTLNEDGAQLIQMLNDYNLLNRQDDKVKVIFIPAILNGKDGVLNLNYNELLTAVDLGI